MNRELAQRVLEVVKANPEEHTQAEWRCETGMCFAGWTAVVTGAKWAEPEYNPESPRAYNVIDPRSGEHRKVWEYAADALDLEPYREGIFNASNTIRDIQGFIDNDGDYPEDLENDEW